MAGVALALAVSVPRTFIAENEARLRRRTDNLSHSVQNGLVVVPMLLRGLFEHKVETLQAEISPHVARTVAFFLAGCRQGGGA